MSMLEGLIGHLFAHVLGDVTRERLWRIRLLPCKVVGRNQDIRVSLSAFLRVAQGDSYLLVRSLHRREAFGPIGGVYKYAGSARRHLDELQFRPQGSSASKDMSHDLRGFLPRRKLLAFLKWFDEGKEREDHTTCLRRELMEELREARVAQGRTLPQLVQFDQLRRIQEGPARAVGQPFTQYRIFDVFDISDPSSEAIAFFADLRAVAETHKDLLLATSREIIAGRSTDGRVIGHHAGYLFGRRRVRPDEPQFSDVELHPRPRLSARKPARRTRQRRR